MLDDISGHKGLLSSIIKQAILDSMLTFDKKNKNLNPDAESGLEFLFGNDVEMYLHFLDIDKDYFQKKLIKEMFSKDSLDTVFTEIKRRMFRINYKKWVQKKNRKLLMMATYKSKIK